MELTRLSLAFGALTVVVRADCWFPDRSPAAHDEPCNSGAGSSACCGKDATCLGKGACLSGGHISRGSCTDIDWQAGACFPFCHGATPKGGSIITPCPASDSQDWIFACGYNCSDPQATFAMRSGDASALTLRPTQLSSAASAAGSALVAITTGASPSATANAPTSTSQREDATFTGGAMAGVGFGVGAPLLVIIGVLSWLLFREKRKNGIVHNKDVVRGSFNHTTMEKASTHGYFSHSAQPLASEVTHIQDGPLAGPPFNAAEMSVESGLQELEAKRR